MEDAEEEIEVWMEGEEVLKGVVAGVDGGDGMAGIDGRMEEKLEELDKFRAIGI